MAKWSPLSGVPKWWKWCQSAYSHFASVYYGKSCPTLTNQETSNCVWVNKRHTHTYTRIYVELHQKKISASSVRKLGFYTVWKRVLLRSIKQVRDKAKLLTISHPGAGVKRNYYSQGSRNTKETRPGLRSIGRRRGDRTQWLAEHIWGDLLNSQCSAHKE